MVKFTNKFGLPEEFYRYRKFKAYSKGDADFSVTGLIRPPRQLLLEELHDDEIEIDVIDQMWALFGTAVHEVLATGSGLADISEEVITMDIAGAKVKAGIDVQATGRHGVVIRDFKVTTTFGYMKNQKAMEEHDWTKQVNCYAHMVRATKKVPVIAVEIYVILRDWSKMRADGATNEYPQSPIIKVTPPLWPDADARAYMEERVRLHTSERMQWELTKEPPAKCSKDERWRSPVTFAVMKKGRKSAVKIVDSLSYAQEMVDKDPSNMYIEKRGGEDVKCLSFCNAARFCSHGKLLLEEKNGNEEG